VSHPNTTQAPPSVRTNRPTTTLHDHQSDHQHRGEGAGRQTWSDTAQRQRGPLPLPPKIFDETGDILPASSSYQKSRGNEIFDTIKHVPVATARQTGGAAVTNPGSGHARDRAAHGTEVHREPTVDSQARQSDPPEHSPPGSPSETLTRPESPSQFVAAGMDDMMLDSVIIPALDNVSRNGFLYPVDACRL
jgi:hypothetical protein